MSKGVTLAFSLVGANHHFKLNKDSYGVDGAGASSPPGENNSMSIVSSTDTVVMLKRNGGHLKSDA